MTSVIATRAARLVLTAGALLPLVVAFGCRGPLPPDPGTTNPSPCPQAGFTTGRWPPACWRPFAADSPFNTALPADRVGLRENSTQALASATKQPVGNWPTIESGGGPGSPVYWASSSDPEFELSCVNDLSSGSGGRPDHSCPIDTARTGEKLRIPAGAAPEGNSAVVVGQPRSYDAHLTVVDPSGTWAYDLWQVQASSSFDDVDDQGHVSAGLSGHGGRVDFSYGGRTRLAGRGTAVDRSAGESVDDANAAHWSELAGRVRIEELQAGKIEHALFLNIPCTEDTQSVYPADISGRGWSCSKLSGEAPPELGSHPLGTRFYLDMTDEEIESLSTVPKWQKTVLKALAAYGGYVGDTNNSPGWLFYIEAEGGNMYTSPVAADGTRAPDPWWKFAASNGWEDYLPKAQPPEKVGKLGRAKGDSTSWATQVWPHLRVVDPCVTPGPGDQAC